MYRLIFILIGTIRLACSLAAHHERQQEQTDDSIKKGILNFMIKLNFQIINSKVE